MYPEKPIYDVGGFPSVRGRDLVDNLVVQASRYEPTYVLGEQAVTLDPSDDGRPLCLTTAEGTHVACGAVIITGGIGTFTPRTLPAGEDMLGRGLAYFVPSLSAYGGRDVVVVGGGDSAVDWALALLDVAASVTLVHRRAAFRAHAASVEELLASRVTVMTDAQVTALRGDEWVEEVEVTGPGGTDLLPAQGVVAALGFVANLGPIREWGLDMAQRRHIVVDTTMATNRPGVYAAGDIAEYVGKVRLISVGFGEVATAVNNAVVYLHPEMHLFPGHTSAGDPPPEPVLPH
jgi:thioredoxin reductase (NADPH)